MRCKRLDRHHVAVRPELARPDTESIVPCCGCRAVIKTVCAHSDRLLSDRQQVGMTQHFLKSYTELLIKTCHSRGVHAMGGMVRPLSRDCLVLMVWNGLASKAPRVYRCVREPLSEQELAR